MEMGHNVSHSIDDVEHQRSFISKQAVRLNMNLYLNIKVSFCEDCIGYIYIFVALELLK